MPWTYPAIMLVAVAAGFAIYWRNRQPLGLGAWERLGVGLGAACGGLIGAKLPFVLADWQGFLSGAAWLDDGKTIMSGLVGGYLGAHVAEWAMGVKIRTCDQFAVPVAAAIGIGRLACFSAGCCYGTMTSLPWGVDFGDGLARHPTQLYESAFHLTAAFVLYRLQRRGMLRGQLIRVYFLAYFAYRFATEFIRPEPELWLGMTGYQWATLLLIPAFAFAMRCCPECREQAHWPRRWKGTAPFSLRENRDSLQPRVLKQTRTLCPTCLEPVLGTTFEQGGQVFLQRECPEHGMAVALLSSDRRHYYLRDEVPHPPLEGRCCCSGPGHRTCVALLEITGFCNLGCPVCYARSPRGEHRPFDDLAADLAAFLALRRSLDVLQLSGGEPLLHPDLLRIIDHCKTLPIDHLMINTNGLELVARRGLAAELARRTPHLELYLQLDGLDAQSHVALRGADLLKRKRTVLETIVEHDLPTTLVCTVVRGVNECQVGELLRFGLSTRQIRGITFQPATFAGRFRRDADALDRVTLADVARLLVEQSDGLLTDDDFKPLPCSNPNCCGFTVAVRRGRRVVPLTRLIRYEDHFERLADRINFNLRDVRAFGGGRADEFFRLVIKPFMDAYTYDQDRVEECCIHLIRPGGSAVSFCRFNTLERRECEIQSPQRRISPFHEVVDARG